MHGINDYQDSSILGLLDKKKVVNKIGDILNPEFYSTVPATALGTTEEIMGRNAIAFSLLKGLFYDLKKTNIYDAVAEEA